MAGGAGGAHNGVIRPSRRLYVAALLTIGCAPVRARSWPTTPATPPSALALIAPADTGLRVDVPPGGNFSLTTWVLEEPVGAPEKPRVIAAADLAGPTGFHDAYFFTDPHDGAMTFFAPENGVHTQHSRFPRSELAEQGDDGRRASWSVAGIHVLTATVAVVAVSDHVCVGQIHASRGLDPALPRSTKPLLELYYDAQGAIVVGIENGPEGGQSTHALATVRPGTPFRYEIRLAGDGTISVGIDGVVSTFRMPESFRAYGMYFKAGAYNQSTSSSGSVGAKVKFYALAVRHGP